MKKRNLGIALLVLLAFVVTTGTFAYWASSVSGANATDTGASVTIGQGGSVTTTVTLNDPTADNTALVPTAYVAVAGDDTATWTYNVDWSDAAGAADGAAGTLAVTFSNYAISGQTTTEAEILAMFSFTVTSGDGAIVAGTPNSVVITVVFTTEPANPTLYNEVANGTLTFDVTFTVS